MRIREWDPATASAAELQAWLRGYNEALAADLPDDPLWSVDRLQEYLSVTMPNERRITWLAEGEDEPTAGTSPVLGYGRLLTLEDLGVLEVFVVPRARGRGIGKALLGAIAARAVAEGYDSLGAEVIGGTPSADFYANYGFTHVYTEMRSILDLATVDWEQLAGMAAAVVQGYRIEYHPGDLPGAMLESYAKAKQVRRQEPGADLDLRPSSYDAERLRASLACLRERGLMPYLDVARLDQRDSRAEYNRYDRDEIIVDKPFPVELCEYAGPAHDPYPL